MSSTLPPGLGRHSIINPFAFLEYIFIRLINFGSTLKKHQDSSESAPNGIYIPRLFF
jgi:hypothetical protein